MKRKFCSILRDNSGATAIEFALIAPMLFWLILATIEYGIIFHIQSLTNHAVGEAARKGKTGNSYQGSGGICNNFPSTNREGMIKCVAEYYLAPWISDGNIVTVNTVSRGPLFGVFGTKTLGLGAADELVVYEVVYRWNIITPILTPLFQGESSQNAIRITGYAIVKNERF